MRFVTVGIMTAFLASATSAQELKYVLNGENTKITWTGTKTGGKHDGGFKTVSGVATVGAGMKISLDIDTASLYSDDTKLTGHLKSPDFFSVKDHPTAKFVSTKVAEGAKGFVIYGDLTLLGKTKAISFPAEVSAGDKLSIQAAFTIDRADFGMTYGKGKVDDTVSLKVVVNASK
jgi:polyisoprenoid-binding protein YceI